MLITKNKIILSTLFIIQCVTISIFANSVNVESAKNLNTQESQEEWVIRVNDSQTRVKLVAKVNLSISELILTDGVFKGTYTIEVPMQPESNETGSIEIPYKGDLKDLVKYGGKLRGTAVALNLKNDTKLSNKRSIECVLNPSEIDKEGKIKLTIVSPRHKLNFKSQYNLDNTVKYAVSKAQ